MISLIILALSLAWVLATVVSAASRPIPALPSPVEALPVAAFGLNWRRLREVRTSRGQRVLWAGEGDATLYRRAINVARGTLYDVGYSWGTAERFGGTVQPVCWEDPEWPDETVLDAIAHAEQALQRDDERLAALEVMRVRAEELDAEIHGDARRADLQALRENLDTMNWAWNSRRRDIASEVLREPLAPNGAPKAAAARLARDLVAQVVDTVARVRERIAREPSKDWLKMAEDPAIRALVREAAQVISSFDEDRAALNNGIGWSKAHSHVGHILAGLPELTIIEASQALAAVYKHRRQLRPEMREALFGEAA